MNYRVGNSDDLGKICSLIREAIADMERRDIRQWDHIYPSAADFLRDIRSGTLYVAENGEDLAAVYVINRESDEAYSKCSWSSPDETACILHRFCVSTAYQNRGIGRLILCHIEAQAQVMGYRSVRLDAFTENPHAVNLYTKSGYQARGFADWRKGRFILMEKVL